MGSFLERLTLVPDGIRGRYWRSPPLKVKAHICLARLPGSPGSSHQYLLPPDEHNSAKNLTLATDSPSASSVVLSESRDCILWARKGEVASSLSPELTGVVAEKLYENICR